MLQDWVEVNVEEVSRSEWGVREAGKDTQGAVVV